jgi:hypothetical protein
VERGWLLLLCGILFVWQPSSFAVEAASTLPTLGMRGSAAVVELVFHGIVAALSAAAGWALWQSSPAGRALAAAAIGLVTIAGVQSLYWSVLPSNVFPADRLPIAALIVAHGIAWLIYLRRSRRFRSPEPPFQ